MAGSSIQRSLLDAFEESQPTQVAGGNVAPERRLGRTNQNDSFLNVLDDAEMANQRHALQAMEQLRDEELKWKASFKETGNEPVSTQLRAETPKYEKSQAEQLELLAGELGQVRSRLNQNQQDQEMPEQGVPTVPQNPSHYQAQYAPPPPSLLSGINNPFSFDRTISAIFKASKVMIIFAVLGCILSVLFALSLPNKYESVAEILIEPRELRVLENTVAPNGLNSNATVAYAESQVRILTSSSVIDPVVEELELAEDPEFNGKAGLGGSLGKFIGLLTGGADLKANEPVDVKKHLYQNLFVTRINQTFTIQIGVTTNNPAKSARIANAIAQSYIKQSSGARSNAAGLANVDLEGRLGELQKKVRLSEENVETYRAENGLLDANGQLVSEVQLGRLNDQLTLAKVQTGDAKTRAELASETDLSDVISGTLPSLLKTSTVNQFRLEYTKAKSRLDRLSTKLGERHPDRIAASAELRSSLDSIGREMKRIVQSAQEDFKRAQAREADLLKQVNELRASAVSDASAKVKLRELDREVMANRKVYESFLVRARETGEEQNISARSARVISEAVPVEQKKGPNRKLIVVGGTIGGGILGAFLALIPFGFAGLRQIVNGVAARQDQPAAAFARPMPAPVQPIRGSGDLYSTQPNPAQSLYQQPAPPPSQQFVQPQAVPQAAQQVVQEPAPASGPGPAAQPVHFAPPEAQPIVQQATTTPQSTVHPARHLSQPMLQPVPAAHLYAPYAGAYEPQPVAQPMPQPTVPINAPAQGVQMSLPGFEPGYAMAPPQHQPRMMQPVPQHMMQPIYVQAPPMMAQAPVQPASPQPQMVYTNWVPVEPK